MHEIHVNFIRFHVALRHSAFADLRSFHFAVTLEFSVCCAVRHNFRKKP
jgi:hypothetical protein